MLVKEGERRTVGSKAFDLYRCSLLGARVPDFIVIPTGLHAREDEEQAVAALREELALALKALGGLVSVRSSSVYEDLEGGSNAGQFKTVLGVGTLEELETAVLAVWRSCKGKPMAVIIQRMLAPDRAGVLFTRNPVSGANTTLIEHVNGLAEGLVSGRREPIRVEVPNGPDGLDGHPFRELVLTARRLEEGFGRPLDIEWALCGDVLFILQARPITSLPPPKAGSCPSYSRVHAEEFFSGQVSPLFHSVFSDIFARYYMGETLEALGIEVDLDGPIMVRHKNHLYVNTVLTQAQVNNLPKGLGRKRMMEVLPPDIREEVSRRKGRASPAGLLKVIRFLLLNRWCWMTHLDEHFKKVVVPGITKNLDAIGDLRTMDGEGLKKAYKDLMGITADHIRVSKWGLVLYSITLSEVMGRFLERNGIGKDGLPGLITGLEDNKTLAASKELMGLADAVRKRPEAMTVVSAEQRDFEGYRKELATVPGGDLIIDQFESILVRYGHRRLSRDLMQPSWRDEPMIPFGMVRSLVLHRPDRREPEAQSSVQKDIAARLPRSKRWAFRILSRYLLRYVSFRELQRFYLDMILSRLRELALEISRRMVADGVLESKDDVFFLDMDDLLSYLSGGPTDKMVKKALFQRLTFYDQAGTPGRYMRGGVDFDAVEKREEVDVLGHAIRGQCVSPGVYTGRARVITDLDRDIEITKGDIIVTRCLDPGQTHFLMMAGALILEVGGMLSHGAILARELGIPTVAQVRNATGILKNGQRLVVNGTKGTVVVDG
jgi:pyruvate,water dikinase